MIFTALFIAVYVGIAVVYFIVLRHRRYTVGWSAFYGALWIRYFLHPLWRGTEDDAQPARVRTRSKSRSATEQPGAYCPRCGIEAIAGASFCAHCGTLLPGDRDASKDAEERDAIATAPNPPNRSKRGIVAASASAAVVIEPGSAPVTKHNGWKIAGVIALVWCVLLAVPVLVIAGITAFSSGSSSSEVQPTTPEYTVDTEQGAPTTLPQYTARMGNVAPPNPKYLPTVAIDCGPAVVGSWDWYEPDFHATVTHKVSAITEYGIDYGDGRSYIAHDEASAREDVYSHRYEAPGVYPVRAWVTDASGARAEASCEFAWSDPGN